MANLSQESSSMGLVGNGGRTDRHDLGHSQLVDCSNDSDWHLSRQQSVRFAAPKFRPSTALASRPNERLMTPTSNTSRATTDARGIDRGAKSVVSGSHDVGITSRSFNPLRLMQRSNDCLVPEDKTGMVSSTDRRRIRMSKSMLTTSDPQSVGYCLDNSPAQHQRVQATSRYAHLNKENTPLSGSNMPALRAPKSMSFLRNRRVNTSSCSTTHAENDLAVQLARQKFREEVEGQSQLKPHSSMFLQSRARRADSSMGWRKSMRNSSNQSAGLSSAVSGYSIAASKQGSLKKTARKVSSSIKTKLKGMFGRRTSDTSASLTRHVSEIQARNDDFSLHVEPPAFHEEASISRGPSRITSVHTVSSPYKLKSQRGSLDSCEGDHDPISDDKSRVTSWTDSLTNTATTHADQGDWERQRLSVIKENGLHVSASRPRSSMASQDYAIGKAIAVDSQRVYSALMRRARDSGKNEEDTRRMSVDKMRSLGWPPPRSSSVDRLCDGQAWSPPTIRCVQPEDDVFQDSASNTTSRDSGSPRSIIRRSRKFIHPVASTNGSPNPWSEKLIEKCDSPSKPRMHSNLELDRFKTTTNRSSAFFASPSSHLFRTASPFRRALRESMNIETDPRPPESSQEAETDYLRSMSAISLPTRHPSSCKSEATGRDDCVESTYSTTTDDRTMDSSLVTKFTVPPQLASLGNATIYTSRTVIPSPRRPTRDVSTTSSVEWKTWLSSHLAQLEGGRHFSKPNSSNSLDSVPRQGHVREKAEIEPPPETGCSPFLNIETSSNSTLGNWRIGKRLSRPTQEVPIPQMNDSPQGENSASFGDAVSKASGSMQAQDARTRSSSRSTPALVISDQIHSHAFMREENASLRGAVSLGTLSQPSSVKQEEVAKRRRARMWAAGDTASSHKSSPGLTAAVEKQFGRPNAGTRAQSTCRILHVKGMPPDTWSESSSEVHTVDSKKMVDSFLNSRHKKFNEHDLNMRSSPAAFI